MSRESFKKIKFLKKLILKLMLMVGFNNARTLLEIDDTFPVLEHLVGNVDVRDYDIDTLRSQVAMVLQKNLLFSGTIKENLRWGNDKATDEEIIEACKLADAHEFVSSFENGYDTFIEQGGTNVSGGQKQRISVSRSVIRNSEILIFDDSSSALDLKTESNLHKEINKKFTNVTKIIIAQRIASVKNADSIIVLENGRISDIGTHNDLMNNVLTACAGTDDHDIRTILGNSSFLIQISNKPEPKP